MTSQIAQFPDLVARVNLLRARTNCRNCDLEEDIKKIHREAVNRLSDPKFQRLAKDRLRQ